MEDVNLDGEDEYYDEGEGEFFDSDANLNVDLEWPDSGYRADCLPLQETQEVLRRTYNMLEQEDRYSSYSGIGYRPGDEVFHILISFVFSIYLLLNIIEKNELSKDLEIQKAENLKLNKFVEELRSRVECQVCFVPPRQGPVPMCPNGHFICTNCKARNRQEGKTHCPTCQQPLGEIRSLLAKIVIENMLHECDLEGCGEMLAHSGFKRHQDSCHFRLVHSGFTL